MKARAHSELLKNELNRRILVLDGAMGTAIQARNLTAEDFGGEKFKTWTSKKGSHFLEFEMVATQFENRFLICLIDLA